ncbi:unnamed protein product [Rhizophagus irregularis]|uniref:Dynein light chain n=1 Tax=Rhizophagus irregularis TaxID=588596 RepID=A0A915YMK8_9GLOM|nr:unnamed protein product [Rhizophagus irregularis]CAB4429503.1 unnamed protein product [Rhizophagus irregularis]CAB4429917.1 unnamed protein product [Rhizophagus irregularis]CAB4476107.1 unnamed protein product [Rhizophagus irregularis]CAB5132990.1 unnamed protein product [Rhizophagus irregularis]
MSSEEKPTIKNVDMTDEMQQEAIDCARHGTTWHCIVGRNFGSYVTHETKHFIYFYIGNIAILLFKSG